MGKKKTCGYEDHFQHIEDMAGRVSALVEVRMLEKELRSLEAENTEEEKSVRKKLAAARRKLTLSGRKLESSVRETLDRGEVELPFCRICSGADLSPLEIRVLEVLLCTRACDELREKACELTNTRKIKLKTVLDLLGGSLKEKAEMRKLIGSGESLFSTGMILFNRAIKGRSEEDFLDIGLNISYRTFSILMGQETGNILLEPYSELLFEYLPLEELIFPEELKKSVKTLIESREFHSDVWEGW
ncbi:MAG: hypothetical protein GF388_10880, partial [Candidatus Aegiribacteria sp.]|nr:hypothetical protein [Candidatus Aegiribacteria sp.]